ncbi:MAG: polymer-forming cytoskeletal protein [Edaphobacter sp.]
MRRWLFAVAVLLTTTLPGFARSTNDHATVGSDITIDEGEMAGDIACVFCTVRIHGEVKGDVAVLFGRVEVDAGRSIAGDVAAFGADVDLGQDATVGGDVAIVAGDVKASQGAMIHGSSTILPGRIWLLLPLAPVMILIGLIWLIVYIVRRNRYQFPAYPRGRGY